MSSDQESVDDEIVRRAAVGDRDAQREIYEVFSDRVYRITRRVVGESDASDVAQEAFLHLFAKLPSFRFESAFPTWLHRLVVNESLQHLRQRGRRVRNTKPLLEQDVARPEETSWCSDAAETLTKAMAMIEPELRLIFQLKEVDELSYAQIGEIVGIPEGTVGSRLNRARRELRDQLLKLGWEQ
ncbi:RNA polymerase sigma factor [Novipirellula rosea]|uniref:RNA polymerase sigma factor RpoE n=1 Tax=Novipirellula rosea TaxID=1031540 RepID=A0ABP8NRB3_9BACT